MKSYLNISNKNFKVNKKRNILTIVGITLAVTIIFAIGTFILSARNSVIESTREKANFEVAFRGVSINELDKISKNAKITEDYSISLTENKIEKVLNDDLTLNISMYTDKAFSNIFSGELIKGNFPATNNDIVIEEQIAKIKGYKIGDSIKLNSGNSLKICGIYKPKTFSYKNISNVYSVISEDEFNNNEKFNVYINLKDKKNFKEQAENIRSEVGINENFNIAYNKELIMFYGEIGGDFFTQSLMKIAIVVIGIILIATVTVIYNSFNLSILERIREFGILKAIGTTRKQMRRILFREGLVMSVIAIPIGIILGYIALSILMNMVIKDSTFLNLPNFKVSINPTIVIVTIILILFTVFISILGPARRVSKISAVTAMKNVNEIRKEKLKRRKTRIIGKIFNIEGALAYKNIKRTPKRFVITVVALTISIIMFNIFSNVMMQVKDGVGMLYEVIKFDAQVASDDNRALNKDALDYIYNTDGIIDQKKMIMDSTKLSIEKDKFSDKGNEYINPKENERNKDYITLDSFEIWAGEEVLFNDFKDGLLYGDINYDRMKKENGIVLIDSNEKDIETGQREIFRNTNYKVGDKIKLLDKDNNIKELKVMAIAEINPTTNKYGFNSINIWMPKEVYQSNFRNIGENYSNFSYDDNLTDEEVSNIEGDLLNKFGDSIQYASIKELEEEVTSMYNDMSMFIYAFLFIVTAISIINIFNTVMSNILLRKRELSTLKGIGLTDRGLRKIIMLEGTLYGIFASVIGGGISYGLLLLLKGSLIISINSQRIQPTMKLLPFIISIVGSVIITYIATIAPLKKIRKLSIVEGIRGED